MIGCIIQTRMGSTRLPGKVLKNLEDDKPVLYFVLKQLQECKMIEKFVIATTTLEEDSKIVDYSKELGIDCFRGSSENVLERHYQCAKKFSMSTIVRIPSDKPLIDPTIVDKTIEFFKEKSLDYVTNFFSKPAYPSGSEVEVFSMNGLENMWKNAKLPSEKEHVTDYFMNHKNDFKISHIANSEDLSHMRWAIDRKEDLELVRKIVSRIQKRPILMNDIVNLLKNDLELIKINENVSRNEGELKSMKKDKEFLDNSVS